MEFLVFLIAIILFIPLTVINVIVVGIKNKFKWKVLRGYFLETAIDIDKFGNKNLRTLLNLTLITKEGYKFGDPRETISSALGKNQLKQTLTTTGKVLCAILDFLDEDHCVKSIRYYEKL
jgi:hypothetical protein